MTHEFHFPQLQMARRPAAAEAFALAGCLVLIVSLSLSMISGFAFASDAAGLAPSSAAADAEGQADGAGMLFDIPAQSLQSALDAFGVATGFSGLYSVDATAGMRSAPLRGRYAPAAALRMLLDNTGLVARFTAPDAFIVEQGQAAAPSGPANVVDVYYGTVQSRVRDAFCADSQLARGDYRLAMTFRVDAQGHVERPALLSSTGNAARDRLVIDTLRSLKLDHAPADPSQPFTMLILPGTLAAACRHE